MRLTVTIDIFRNNPELWGYYYKLINHSHIDDDVMEHCLLSYLNALIFVAADMPFYVVMTKINIIEECAMEYWGGEYYWQMLNNTREARVNSIYNEIRDIGGNFLCTLINSDTTASLVSRLNINRYIIGDMDYRTVSLADRDILTFNLTLQ